MATLTGKANVIQDCQIAPSLSPFCSALENTALGTHTAPGGEALSTGQVPAATPRQSLAEAVAGSSCWSLLSPSQQVVAHLHSQCV